MGIEPSPANRLHLIYQSTRDARLRDDLEPVMNRSEMSFQPSAELLVAIRGCNLCEHPFSRLPVRQQLCATHRRKWDLERCTESDERMGGSFVDLFGDVLRDSDVGAELLLAFRTHAAAVNLVWEAHRRGAASLPPAVVATLEQARRQSPQFLRGGDAPPREIPVRS